MYRNEAIETLETLKTSIFTGENILKALEIAIEDMKVTELHSEDIFERKDRIEYTCKNGYKEIVSHYGHPAEYYERHFEREITGRQYASMLRFKDNTIKCYDLRWKNAKAVIDLMAKEVGIDINKTFQILYYADSKDESYIVNQMRKYCDDSGDKVKLKKRIKELELQVQALTNIIKGDDDELETK